jgi:hypothetical protein
MKDTFESILFLSAILILVIFIGVGLNIFESFTNYNQMKQIRNPDTMEQTGLVSSVGGNITNSNFVYTSPGQTPSSQYKNVKNEKEFIKGVLNKHSSQIPWNIYSSTDQSKITRSTGGLPLIILNPDSNPDKQEVCKLNDSCEDYVIDRNLYCPMGMERISTGSQSGKRYNGCYSASRKVPSLGCYHDSTEATSMNGGNMCRLLSQKKVQRVGTGFVMLPPAFVFNNLLTKPISQVSDAERNEIITMAQLKQQVVSQMLFYYEPSIKRAVSDKLTRQQLLSYYITILQHAYIFYQPVTDSMTKPRAGFILYNRTIPSLRSPGFEIDYNITRVSNIGDTTKSPLPSLEKFGTASPIGLELPTLPTPPRPIPPTPTPVSQAMIPTPSTAAPPSLPAAVVSGAMAAAATPPKLPPNPAIPKITPPKLLQSKPRTTPLKTQQKATRLTTKPANPCPNGQAILNNKCTPAAAIKKELDYWSNSKRRTDWLRTKGRNAYNKYMNGLRNTAKQYKLASGVDYKIPPNPK